ncbi:helix-turn-helix domain-containing protein [Streptomyces sp. enrichment culture]|uniref:helix-turn-helix domain-containing protein n=1 Tax=Streptomyces sp. enrichment culture TaxID=1795815 RepID=UPI003F55799F
MEDETWLTIKEAALLAGVDVQTTYSWIRRGHLEVSGLDHRGRKLFRHPWTSRGPSWPPGPRPST